MTEKLNCRPGDLAYIHGLTQTPEANGLIVTVVRRVVVGDILRSGLFVEELASKKATWAVQGHSLPVRTYGGKFFFATERSVPDENLRPIRDQPGEDETLRWVGTPKYREDHPASLAAVRESIEDLA